jgi:hypothetical protein
MELQDKIEREWLPADQAAQLKLVPKVPKPELERYLRVRKRNMQVLQFLIQMSSRGDWDYLTLGQDDARPYGPHYRETKILKGLVERLAVGGSVYFCEGIDQLSNILVSRALLKEATWTPRVRIAYSDPSRIHDYARFESKTIYESIRDQIFASGARLVENGQIADYELFVNLPKRSDASFGLFLAELKDGLDQGFPICVADLNLSPQGTADPKLFDGLLENQRMMKLLAFAGWNTAGNTLGTAIPAANVYLMARRTPTNALQREIAQREFLLHRFVNDYAYHKFTRPVAYSLIEQSGNASRDETGEPTFSEVESFVQRDLEKHLERYFAEQFFGRKFYAGSKPYEVDGLNNIHISLPWPRAYEVRLEFSLTAKPSIH